jgi:hypothetical protein
MRYKEIHILPKDVQIGDRVFSAFDRFAKVEKIEIRNGTHYFLSNIHRLETHDYDLDTFVENYCMVVRRDTLKETLKLL